MHGFRISASQPEIDSMINFVAASYSPDTLFTSNQYFPENKTFQHRWKKQPKSEMLQSIRLSLQQRKRSIHHPSRVLKSKIRGVSLSTYQVGCSVQKNGKDSSGRKLCPNKKQDWKGVDIIYFFKCSGENYKQGHTISKINVFLLPNVHGSYFSVKILASQENPVWAYLEMMSPEEMAKAPCQHRQAKSVNELLATQILPMLLKFMPNPRFTNSAEIAVLKREKNIIFYINDLILFAWTP